MTSTAPSRPADLDTATRALVTAVESGEWDDLHRLAATVADLLPVPPTVPAHAPAGTPESPRCPECGLIPDRTRPTCLTCLTGRCQAAVRWRGGLGKCGAPMDARGECTESSAHLTADELEAMGADPGCRDQ